MRAYKLTMTGGAGWLVTRTIEELAPEIENADLGEHFQIEIITMPVEEYEALREFDGF